MRCEATIRALAAGTELRTWSLIVTIFGDLARAPGAEIPGPVLSALTGRIGIRPEAMRVALHRLRKDDWIGSHRVGRSSNYFLTETGRVECERATDRIFAREGPDPGAWHVVIAGPLDPPDRLALDGAMAAAGGISLAPGAWLGPGPAPDTLAPGLFSLDGAAPRLPDWLRASLLPQALADDYARFDLALAKASSLLAGNVGGLPALDRTAIRILAVHSWRRLVLRHADLPDGFFPAGWPGARVRGQVHALLDRLGAPSLADLTEAVPV